MAERIEIIDVTIPAGTAVATPATVNLNIPDGVVRRIEQRWPPGPAGLVGLKVRHSAQIIIPRSGGAFLVTEDEVVIWDVDGLPTGNKWSVVGYNTDINNHTIQFRILLDEIPTPQRSPVQLVPIE